MILVDQLYGNMEFTDTEEKIIKSKSFERLRRIKQLGFVEYIYPGAVHTRYQHSLGVCQCVTEMYQAVIKNNPDFYREGDLELLRMMALVHDLGHSPFSHASEELSDISHEQRLYDILQLEKKNIILPETYGLEAWELVYQVYMGEGMVYFKDKHLITLHSFMDNYIDADKLDYLQRDALNCGVTYGKFDKNILISNLTVIDSPKKKGMQELALQIEGIQALESFILARYYMFTQVYMHPEERMMRWNYYNAMVDILKDEKYPDDIKKFLKYDDTHFIGKLSFLYDRPYVLVYDAEFDNRIYTKITHKFPELIVDTPRKAIFRKDTDDATIFVYDKLLDRVITCAEASPILKSIEYLSIHKLRCYAKKELAEGIVKKLRGIVK